MTDVTSRVRLTGISKRFGAVRAIRHADLEVLPGSVHAIVGENGAGKSTLIKILAGAEFPDTGEMVLDEKVVSFSSTSDAIGAGIATVYQEPNLFGELTVAENIFIGRERRHRGVVDWRTQHGEVSELLELMGLSERYATVPVDELSIATKQQVAIAKALAQDASVLILDEPSAILTDAEIDVLFGVVRRLRKRGVAIIYISHRLDELFRIADSVSVMRDGDTTGTHAIADMTVRSLAEAMVGGLEVAQNRRRDMNAAKPVLELEGLSRDGDFHDVNVRVREGEVVALYGLVGSGAAEVSAVLWGMSKATAGRIMLDGTKVAPRSPGHAQKLGIGLLPADRKGQGVFSFQTIAFNMSAARIPLFTAAGLWFSHRKERRVAQDMIKRLAIKTRSEEYPVASLSGGNAQKVVLARQLVDIPRVLVLEEPTQGVDIRAKEEIHTIIGELADQGVTVLIATSDLPEALRIADRVVVVRAGTTVTEFGPDATQVDVLAAAAGDAAEAKEVGA